MKLSDLKQRGYVELNNCFYPPNSPEAQKAASVPKTKVKANRREIKRTGWIDDDRNISNKASKVDMFDRLIQIELGIEVWNEFHFSERKNGYRLDKALPVDKDGRVLKIAIEINGGIFRKGGGAHSRPANIVRDMKKANDLQAGGWRLISVQPGELLTSKTLCLIKKLIANNL